MKKELLVYVDMDDVICDYTSSYNNAIKSNPKIHYPQSQYGFFRNLIPVENSIESIKLLSDQEYIDLYILTAPSYKNPLCYSEKREWVEIHLGMSFVKKLIISPNKGLNKGDYLIDDNTSGKGQENFEGKILKFGSIDYPNWDSIVKYFMKERK